MIRVDLVKGYIQFMKILLQDTESCKNYIIELRLTEADKVLTESRIEHLTKYFDKRGMVLKVFNNFGHHDTVMISVQYDLPF